MSHIAKSPLVTMGCPRFTPKTAPSPLMITKFLCMFSVVCGRGLVLLWWRCDTLCTFGFVDDASVHTMGPMGLILILIFRVGLSKPQRWGHLLGPWRYPKCLCVCVMCSWEPCTVFSKCTQPYTSVVSLYQVTWLPVPRAPVGRTAPARPSSELVAGQPPSAQRTAHSPHGLGHQYQLAVQTAIKRLSKFNRCHLSHIKEDTGQPSVPVQEFNPIACSPSLPGLRFEPRLASVHRS